MRAAIVVALVAISVLGMVVVGTRGSGEWLANGGYW
jgi:hypothetical protein